MSQEQKDAVDVLKAGGGFSNVDLAKIDGNVSQACDYCGNSAETIDHLIWECSFFHSLRTEVDAELAAVPCQYLPNAVKRGIAPATQCNHENAYWGQQIGDEVEQSTKALLGCMMEVPYELQKVLKDAWQGARNARQCLARIKGPFGQGTKPIFPHEVNGIAPDNIIVYGDGSVKCPT